MDTATRTELIRRYREGYSVVEKALAGASTDALDRADADGWTARQVAHHLADSEMTSALRLRKLLAEPNPVIYGYDEEAFARSLHYGARPIEASLLAFRAARESTATLFEFLSEHDWARSGWHTESGPYSVETWLEIYAAHAHDHAAQISRALGASR
ncbi:MAG: DinB family protein [Dehalococcoidia bacterium]